MPISYLHPRRPPPVFQHGAPQVTVTPPRFLSRPHTPDSNGAVSTSELSALVFLLFVLLVLVGLVAWTLAVKCSELAIERRNDAHPSSPARRIEEGTKSVPKLFNKIGFTVEGGIRNAIFGQKGGYKNTAMTDTSEVSGLLGAFEGRPYYGNRLVRNGDGTSEGTSTEVVHRDDCEGQCGIQSRRRSWEWNGGQ